MSRILLVTQSLPWPLRRNGGAQRTELLRRALSKWGDVDVIGVGGDEKLDTPDQHVLAQQVGLLRHFDTTPTSRPTVRAPWPVKSLLFHREDWARRYRPDPAIVAWIAAQQPYDLFVGRYLKAAAKAGLLERRPGGVPAILDFDDVDHHLFRSHREADPWPGFGGRLAARMVQRQLECISLQAPTRVAATWVCSEEDSALFDAQRGVSVLPNVPFREVHEAPSALPPVANSSTLLFVGDLTFASNRDGVLRFIADVWPQILAAVPMATLELVGKIDPNDRSQFAASGVKVLGYVEDLVDAYRRCAFTVAPIWTGGGTKIKVVESLAYGRPCVSTEHCLRGYGPLVRAGVLEGSDEPATMARLCVALLTKPSMRDDLGTRAAAETALQYSTTSFQRVVDETVQSVMRAKPRATLEATV